MKDSHKIFFMWSGFLLFILFSSCNKKKDKDSAPPDESLPRISIVEKKFVTQNGKPIRLWGLNYGSPEGLIEDDWMQSEKWADIEKNIKDIKLLGANLVRVAIQYHTIMKSAAEPNQDNLQQLRKLALLAQENKLYFMVSGLGSFKKEDQPDWYVSMDEKSRWATQALYWESIAGALGDIPSVFSYELMNEPVVPSTSTTEWLPGGGIGGYFFAQNITRVPGGRPMQEIMSAWIQEITLAIRKKDQKTFITVGFLPFANYAQFSADVDINNTHIYPKTGEEAVSDEIIQRFVSNKPLIVTETFTLTISPADWEKWIQRNNKFVEGWVGMHGGKTLEELTPPSTIPEAIFRDFLLKFSEMSESQK